MNDFAAMGSAIYGRLGTVQYSYPSSGTVLTTGTLGTYDTLSLQGSATPYVVFQLQASLDDYTFGTVSGFSGDYLVKSVTNRQTPHQGIIIYGQIHDNFQDAPLSIAGGYALRVRRHSLVHFRDTDAFWHIGGIYRIDFWHNG